MTSWLHLFFFRVCHVLAVFKFLGKNLLFSTNLRPYAEEPGLQNKHRNKAPLCEWSLPICLNTPAHSSISTTSGTDSQTREFLLLWKPGAFLRTERKSSKSISRKKMTRERKENSTEAEDINYKMSHLPSTLFTCRHKLVFSSAYLNGKLNGAHITANPASLARKAAA